MTQASGNEPRLFLKDEHDNYYVQTADMSEPARVPDDKKAEVDEVINGQNDTAGFIALGTFGLAAPTTQHGGHQLTTLGACNGECGRNFGVLGQQQIR
jgi:hypothetical protein